MLKSLSRLGFAVLVLSLSSIAAAESSSETTRFTGARQLSSALREAIPTYQPPSYWVTIGSGFSVQQEVGGWGVPVSVLGRLKNTSYFVGIDTGVHFWEFIVLGQGKVRKLGVPILPTFLYQSVESRMDSFHPFLGISAGAELIRDASNNVTPFLEVLVRAGVQFDLNDMFSLSLDTRFGAMGSHFVFFPQLSAGVKI